MSVAAPEQSLLGDYQRMQLIRVFETEAERQYKLANIGGYCHLSIGQEALCVGSVGAMADDDLLVTGYRCHGFALARGLSPESVMAELFGRVDGCAHGRGGSMHLLDPDRGYYGGWGIVGGQLPIATGLALSLVRRGEKKAVLCELGDGAVNIGAFHEALNLAALWDLPVVFLVVNNRYGMGTAVHRASAEPELFRRAQAYRMIGERINGDDLDEVGDAVGSLLAQAREDGRPSMLEAITYRYRGHSVADPGTSYRTKDEIARYREGDPILVARERLLADGADEAEISAVDAEIDARVGAAVEFALASSEPPLDRLAAGTYAPGSAEQFARMRPGSPFGEAELVFEAGLGT